MQPIHVAKTHNLDYAVWWVTMVVAANSGAYLSTTGVKQSWPTCTVIKRFHSHGSDIERAGEAGKLQLVCQQNV